jgi:hypothetical protein
MSGTSECASLSWLPFPYKLQGKGQKPTRAWIGSSFAFAADPRAWLTEKLGPLCSQSEQADPWIDQIADYLDSREVGSNVLIKQIALEGLCLNNPKIGTADQRRIIKILASLGWEPSGKRTNKGQRFALKGGS